MNARPTFVPCASARDAGSLMPVSTLQIMAASEEALMAKLAGTFGNRETERLVAHWLLASMAAGEWFGIDARVAGQQGSGYYCRGNYWLYNEESARWSIAEGIMIPKRSLWDILIEKGIISRL